MFKRSYKAGRISLSGNLNDGRKVKVYESFNYNQIKLRKKLGNNLKMKMYYLNLITNDKHFIVEEWISGKSYLQ